MTHDRSRDVEDGFSLVELMTVIVILGILIGTAIASYAITAEGSRRVTCIGNQRTMRSAVMEYTMEHFGSLPPDLDAVRSRVNWANGFARCASTDDPYLYDATNGVVTCPTAGHQIR